jgi:hypothetical protein
MRILPGRSGLKRVCGRFIGLMFAAIFVVQAVGAAFALRRKPEVSLAPDLASDEVAIGATRAPGGATFVPVPVAT